MKFTFLTLMMYFYIIKVLVKSLRISSKFRSIVPARYKKEDIIKLLHLENVKSNKTEYDAEEAEILKHHRMIINKV